MAAAGYVVAPTARPALPVLEPTARLPRAKFSDYHPVYGWIGRIIADMFPLETYFDARINFPLPTLFFTVAPTSVAWGDSAVLTWASDNAHTLVASGGWSGSRGRSGEVNTEPLWQTTSFTLLANGPGGGPVTQTVTVEVTAPPPPTAIIGANPASMLSGESSTLTWVTTNATAVTASGGWSGSVGLSGEVNTGALTATRTYTITATGVAGTTPVTASVTITVTQPPPPLFNVAIHVIPGQTPRPDGPMIQYNYAGLGSISQPNMPSGGSALGMQILSIGSQRVNAAPYGDDLWIEIAGGSAYGVTQTNQFDSVSVIDDSGITRTFTTAPQTNLQFGSSDFYGSRWVWMGTNMVMRTPGKSYTFTFRKQS